MKIVHVIYSLEMGGAEVLVAQLCRMQRARGHEVSVCAYSKLGPVGEMLAAEGIPIYIPGVAPVPRTMLRYMRHFRKLKPDVVHCHNPAPTLQAALAARLAGVPCIVSTRHSLVAPPYEVREERRYNLMARMALDWIVGICEITCTNLRGTPGAPVEKIVRVYNGAEAMPRVDATDLIESVQAECSRRYFTLLFVGRLAEVKDIPTMLRAVAIAAKQLPELRLWIVGDWYHRERLEALSEELEITGRVTFFGTRLDTEAFFSAADVFVMSSISEGVPMSLLQAMSIGLPAIATDVGGMSEVLRLSESGLLTPVGDAEGYAETILKLASDPALRKELGAKARTAYQQYFTLEQMEAAYMGLYRKTLGAKV